MYFGIDTQDVANTDMDTYDEKETKANMFWFILKLTKLHVYMTHSSLKFVPKGCEGIDYHYTRHISYNILCYIVVMEEKLKFIM